MGRLYAGEAVESTSGSTAMGRAGYDAGVEIQYLLVCDYAEIVNGKLYLMGGGWDRYDAREVPTNFRLAVAAGVRIGWEETNVLNPVRIIIEDDDGKELARIDGTMQVGRPANLPPGSTQLSQIAANLPLRAEAFGGYRVRMVAGDGERSVEATVPFRVYEKSG
jgi:hypothetical protein